MGKASGRAVKEKCRELLCVLRSSLLSNDSGPLHTPSPAALLLFVCISATIPSVALGVLPCPEDALPCPWEQPGHFPAPASLHVDTGHSQKDFQVRFDP